MTQLEWTRIENNQKYYYYYYSLRNTTHYCHIYIIKTNFSIIIKYNYEIVAIN